jgi:hypothetical protein
MDEVKLRNSENKRCRDSRMKKKGEKRKAEGSRLAGACWSVGRARCSAETRTACRTTAPQSNYSSPALVPRLGLECPSTKQCAGGLERFFQRTQGSLMCHYDSCGSHGCKL